MSMRTDLGTSQNWSEAITNPSNMPLNWRPSGAFVMCKVLGRVVGGFSEVLYSSGDNPSLSVHRGAMPHWTISKEDCTV